MNVLTPDFEPDLAECVERSPPTPPSAARDHVRRSRASWPAATSRTCSARFGPQFTACEASEVSCELEPLLRRMETCGKPLVAAINGVALGGGFEVAPRLPLRASRTIRRPASACPRSRSGCCRAAAARSACRGWSAYRGAEDICRGRHWARPKRRSSAWCTKWCRPRSSLGAARRWLLGRARGRAALGLEGLPRAGRRRLQQRRRGADVHGRTALAAKKTQHNYPAPAAILSCVFEGTLLPIDKGLQIESKYFAQLVTGPVARNLIRTMFVNKGRPTSFPCGRPTCRSRRSGSSACSARA